MSDNIACWKTILIDHILHKPLTEINEDSRLINARVNALTRQNFPMISLAMGYE